MNKVMEYNFGKMDQSMKVNIKMDKNMVKGNISGKMVQSIKEIG